MILLLFALHYVCGIVSSAPTSSNSTTTLESENGTPIFGDSTQYRSTSDIIIACFSTILLCTWNAAHPNVREYNAAEWRHLLAKLRLFILSLVLPEVLMMFAFKQYYGAYYIAEEIGNGWTPVEGHFLQMGGIIFLHNGKHRFLPPEGLIHNPRNDPFFTAALEKLRGLHSAHITENDILDRSKADGIAKFLTLGQTVWFIVQFIARPIQGLALTELEVITLAYAALNAVTWFLWKRKPLDVKCPVIIDLEGFPDPTKTFYPTSPQSMEPAQSNESHQERENIRRIDMWGQTFRQLLDKVLRELELKRIKPIVGPLGHTGEPEKKEEQRTSNDRLEGMNIYSRRPGISKTANILVSIVKFPLILLFVVGLVIASLATFGPVVLLLVLVPVVFDATTAMARLSEEPDSDWIYGDHAFAPFYYGYSIGTRTRTTCVWLASLSASVFGAIHCIAWSFSFPSGACRTLWRVCSLLITILPLGSLVGGVISHLTFNSFAALPNLDADDRAFRFVPPEAKPNRVVVRIQRAAYGLIEGVSSILAYFFLFIAFVVVAFCTICTGSMLVLYLPARIILAVVASLSLPSIPDTAHQALQWSKFLPHL